MSQHISVNHTDLNGETPWIFMDRDGVILEDEGYTPKSETPTLLVDTIGGYYWRRLRDLGFQFGMVSNQSAINRQLNSLSSIIHRNELMIKALLEMECKLNKTTMCPHTPDENCKCRKPSPTMFYDFLSQGSDKFLRSFMIGDKITDIEAGNAAGIPPGNLFLVLTGNGLSDYENASDALQIANVVPSINTALEMIEKLIVIWRS